MFSDEPLHKRIILLYLYLLIYSDSFVYAKIFREYWHDEDSFWFFFLSEPRFHSLILLPSSGYHPASSFSSSYILSSGKLFKFLRTRSIFSSLFYVSLFLIMHRSACCKNVCIIIRRNFSINQSGLKLHPITSNDTRVIDVCVNWFLLC